MLLIDHTGKAIGLITVGRAVGMPLLAFSKSQQWRPCRVRIDLEDEMLAERTLASALDELSRIESYCLECAQETDSFLKSVEWAGKWVCHSDRQELGRDAQWFADYIYTAIRRLNSLSDSFPYHSELELVAIAISGQLEPMELHGEIFDSAMRAVACLPQVWNPPGLGQSEHCWDAACDSERKRARRCNRYAQYFREFTPELINEIEARIVREKGLAAKWTVENWSGVKPADLPEGSSAPQLKMDVDEANRKAMELAARNPSFVEGKAEDWGRKIGCSATTARKTELWKKVMDRTGRGRNRTPAGKPKTVSLTDTVLAETGVEDEALLDLIEEQQVDFEASPLDELAKSPVVRRE